MHNFVVLKIVGPTGTALWLFPYFPEVLLPVRCDVLPKPVCYPH